MVSGTSAAVQDYLKAIYLLGVEGGAGRVVTTSEVARRLGVSAAAATGMLKRLAADGLVRHAPYRGVALTPHGLRVALEVIRHHRLLETYLQRALGVPWDEVHAEAEVLEHVLSEDLEERIAELLGHPTADPHGHPIPSRELAVPERPGCRLWDAPDGEDLVVESVSDEDAELLRYLDSVGIRPGAGVRIVRRGPRAVPVFVVVGGGDAEQALSRELAEAVWVRR